MPIGDIKVTECKIGDIDLVNSGAATAAGFNIYEDILDPYGPKCDIRVLDAADAMGATRLNGSFDKDVKIRYSLADDESQVVGFTFKMLENKNLDDRSGSQHEGSLHSKQYDIRAVSKELLVAQANFVEKSYNDLTSTMVQDIIKENLKSDKPIEIQEQTSGKRKMAFYNEHPSDVLKKLNNEHVASQSKSSFYSVFQQQENGEQKYVITTFEKMFQQEPVVTLKQSSNLNASGVSEEEKQNSIMHIKVSDSFFTGDRALTAANRQQVNLTTFVVTDGRPQASVFKLPDEPVHKGKLEPAKSYPVRTIEDKGNNPQHHSVAEARKSRTEFLTHLSENYAELEVPGNPKIKLGSMVNLIIPNKSDGSEGQEKQFTGKALIVAIRHKIKPMGESPRYTMILRAVKASYKHGGGGNA